MTPTEVPSRAWLFQMARSTAYEIARRSSSRPLLPVGELPLEYDNVDGALTVLTVDQTLDKLPSIYRDVMRLVGAGFTQFEIAERGHPDRHRQIPDGQGRCRVAGRVGNLPEIATQLPTAHTTCPHDRRPVQDCRHRGDAAVRSCGGSYQR